MGQLAKLVITLNYQSMAGDGTTVSQANQAELAPASRPAAAYVPPATQPANQQP